MIFAAKEITLKNGKTIVLRSPSIDDAEQMISFLKMIYTESEFLARYPEEVDIALPDEIKFLQTCLDSSNELMIVAIADGVIAGNCHISFMRSIKTRHRAEVMISLRKEFWGFGLGTAMFTEVINLAKDKGIFQLELEVIEGNERALALYRKTGFEIIAEHPDAYLYKDGSFKKAIHMRKVL